MNNEDVTFRTRHNTLVWWTGYVSVVVTGLVIAAYARRQYDAPFLGLSLAIVVALVLGWVIRPLATLYTVLFLTAISDRVTVWWFPFAKNLSSAESISYVADALTVSPLELALGTGFVVSLVRRYAESGRVLRPSPLTRPVVVFSAFVGYGFLRGIMLGGDLRIAVLEGRGLVYIGLMYAIVVNECTENAHLRRAVAAVLAGVLVQVLLSLEYLNRIDPAVRSDLESLTEHGSSLGHNLVILMLLVFLVLGVRAWQWRWGLTIAVIPTMYVYLLSQRRSGVAALLVALGLVAVVLFWRSPRRFWFVVPAATVLLVGYTLAFWNSASSIGFPAQAIKTVVAPDQASAKDQSSDLYRMVETFNVNFTIRSSPLFGLGFGLPFYQPVQLPNITTFDLAAYTPHNSILWLWIKTGFGGFAAMIYLFAKSLMLGAERVRRMAHGPDLVVSIAAAAFVLMFAVYTWVDISWDARNTVFLGLALAICARAPEPREMSAVAEDQSVADRTTPSMTSA
ncbi:MAG: O-antigen ligase family protein [Ilumatobacteraceae bacterium]|nr:O-antigen ligase family protein [Ilumatobacteraceae bacterium]